MNGDDKMVNVIRDGKAATTGTILELIENKLGFTRPYEGMIVTYVLVR